MTPTNQLGLHLDYDLSFVVYYHLHNELQEHKGVEIHRTLYWNTKRSLQLHLASSQVDSLNESLYDSLEMAPPLKTPREELVRHKAMFEEAKLNDSE